MSGVGLKSLSVLVNRIVVAERHIGSPLGSYSNVSWLNATRF